MDSAILLGDEEIPTVQATRIDPDNYPIEEAETVFAVVPEQRSRKWKKQCYVEVVVVLFLLLIVGWVMFTLGLYARPVKKGAIVALPPTPDSMNRSASMSPSSSAIVFSAPPTESEETDDFSFTIPGSGFVPSDSGFIARDDDDDSFDGFNFGNSTGGMMPEIPNITVVPQTYWRPISPMLHGPTTPHRHPYSVSLSYDGTKLGVFHNQGISVYELNDYTKEWTLFGDELTRDALMSDALFRWNDVFDPQRLITAQLTLAASGRRLLWEVTYSYGDNDETTGKAVLYQLRQDGVWRRISEVLTLGESPGGSYSLEYGPIVAYARTDGNTIVVGTAEDNNEFVREARVMERRPSTSSWVDLTNPIPGDVSSPIPGVLESSWFGASVAISGDGRTIALASPRAGPDQRGKVEVYTIAEATLLNKLVWVQRGKDIMGDSPNHNFGVLSLSRDGMRLAVGTPNEGRGKLGTVRIFDYFSSRIGWGQIGILAGEYTHDSFGQMVSLSPEGSVIAIAAPRSSKVCVYGMDHTTIKTRIKNWTPMGDCIQLEKPSSGLVGESYLRFSISLSETGDRLAVSVPQEYDNNTTTMTGYVEVYEVVKS